VAPPGTPPARLPEPELPDYGSDELDDEGDDVEWVEDDGEEPAETEILETSAARAVRLQSEILDRLAEGATREAAIAALTDDGMTPTEATHVVDAAIAAAEEEEYGPSSVLLGVVGGLVAAVVAGAAWGLMIVHTDSQWAIAAWGVGLACGMGVRFLSRSRGLPLQITAAACSILGIAIGKYAAVYMFVKQSLADEHPGMGLGILSPEMIRMFFAALPDLLSVYDVLFVVLAVASAWGMLRAQGLKRPPTATGAPMPPPTPGTPP
jgi:hypothetical protein